MSNCIVAPVPIQLVDFMWPHVEPHLDRVVKIAEDEISLQSIKAKLYNGSSMLVAVIKDNIVIAAITMEKLTFENGRSALVLPVVGGDELDEWVDQVIELAKIIAKDIGCQELRGLGARKGWSRKLKNTGWQDAYMVLKYNLEN